MRASAILLMLVPAAGGLVVGPLVHFFAREAKGHGVPEVMDAVANQRGRIRPRVAAVKTLASAISIGVVLLWPELIREELFACGSIIAAL